MTITPTAPEQQALIDAARSRWPDINPTGLHRHPSQYHPPTIQPDQIVTALAVLKQCRPVSHSTVSGYRLKHLIEARCGRYVSHGATLVAAHALNFRISAFGGQNPNAMISISKVDLRRLAVRS